MDALIFTVRHQFEIGIEGMQFDLIYRWNNFRGCKKCIQGFLREVANSNRAARWAYQFLHLLPRINVRVTRRRSQRLAFRSQCHGPVHEKLGNIQFGLDTIFGQ